MNDQWPLVLTYFANAAAFTAIFHKAGYPAWYGLLMLIPGVNVGVLVWFAAATWPLEMGYAGQGGNAKVDTAWELKMALRKANTLEKRRQYAAAVEQFEHVIRVAGDGHSNADLARERIRLLREKMGGAAGG